MAFRLTASSKDLIEFLEADSTVTYSYYQQNGQLFLTMIHGIQ
ncbi:hypothetical protein [Anaerobacillus sp. CMMVII]|nr:hypothetical protein [Anaerobacillus sp. CMMVII]